MALQLALDSISLDIVRKKIRSEVLENDTCRRVRKQLKEQLKNMVIDLGTNLTKLQRLSKSFQDLTGNLLHRGGHEVCETRHQSSVLQHGAHEIFVTHRRLSLHQTRQWTNCLLCRLGQSPKRNNKCAL
jgi:hypothetical protein